MSDGTWDTMNRSDMLKRDMKIKVKDIKNERLQDMPCSVCYRKKDVKELHINNTIHALCKKCRKCLYDELSEVE